MARKNQKKKKAPRRKQDRKVVKAANRFCKIIHPAWSFAKTDKGTKRTCTTCGFNVTEIGRDVIITAVKDRKEEKRAHYHENKQRLANG